MLHSSREVPVSDDDLESERYVGMADSLGDSSGNIIHTFPDTPPIHPLAPL